MSLPMLQEQGGAVSGLVHGLGLGLQQVGPSIQEMIMNRQKQQAIQKILLGDSSERSSKPDLSLEPTESSGMASSGMDITPEKILAIGNLDPQMAANMARIYQGQQKERAQKQKVAQETKVGQASFDRMAELLREGNIGLGSKAMGAIRGGKTAESVGEFESLSGGLEAMLVDRVSRGTLSNARFKYITETLLPKPNDRDATIKGKLKALARELDLDPSALLGKKGKESVGKSEEGFVLMRDPQGNTRQIPKNKAIEAQRAGGKLVK